MWPGMKLNALGIPVGPASLIPRFKRLSGTCGTWGCGDGEGLSLYLGVPLPLESSHIWEDVGGRLHLQEDMPFPRGGFAFAIRLEHTRGEPSRVEAGSARSVQSPFTCPLFITDQFAVVPSKNPHTLPQDLFISFCSVTCAFGHSMNVQ